MEQIIHFQQELYTRILKAKTNFKKSPKDRITKEYIESKLESIEDFWLEFKGGHKDLMRTSDLIALDKSEYTKNDMYGQCEEVYREYKRELKSKLSSFNTLSVNPNMTQSQSASHSKVKLPKVNIQSFSGKYSEWNTFRDLFQSLVNNNDNLDDVQKLLYLKGYLTGEAEQLLSNIPITHDNYARSWKLLEERYNNKRYISHQILKKLLSQKNVAHESASALKELMDTTNDCLSALSNIGINTENWDILVIHMLGLRLDPETKRQWEFSSADVGSSDELPTYKQFQEFLTRRYRALEFLDSRSNFKVANKIKTMHVANNNVHQCQLCSEAHKLNYCNAFKGMSIESRREFARNKNICYRCLGNNHSAKNCYTDIKCNICKRRHHVLLHPSDEGNAKGYVASTVTINSIKDESIEPSSSSSNNNYNLDSNPIVTCFTQRPNQILLATALVQAVAKDGQSSVIRALLDQGSQSSFITEAMVQQLGLKKTLTKSQIIGVGGDKGLISKAMVNLKITSRTDPNVIIKVKAHVLKSITTLLPTSQVRLPNIVEFQNIVLADPFYHTPNRVDMLLGADIYGQVLQDGVKRGPHGWPVAQRTSLGWILSGSLGTTTAVDSWETKVMHVIEDNKLLQRFWQLEDDISMSREKLQTEDQRRCEEIFVKTTQRDDEGRYVVRLPLKNEEPKVSRSLEIAQKRLFSLERRLKTGDLKQKYREVLNEYMTLSHMELVPAEEVDNPKAIYLPHHAVVREDKQTTKLRVVFDASCSGTNNKSLNDHLLVGPTLQADLRHLVMQWRMSRICLTADIIKMYRQIKMHKDDSDYQRILWRDNADEEIKHYRMQRVTFGVASSPYLAVRTLHQLSHDEGQQYSAAAKALTSQFYMDDFLGGCENVEEGIILYKEINELLGKGGFSVQKWSSNSEELLQKMKDDQQMGRSEGTEEGIEEGLKIKTDEVVKIVGLIWRRSEDSFRYKIDLPELQEPATKRTIISDICRFYDPLGWVGPSIIVSKILIQKLWLAGLDWDEKVPNNISNEWKTYREELKVLTNVSIPRWTGSRTGEIIELHGFSDASKDAYAAVVYARVIDAEGNINVSLISAKTKVAPVKQVSIPRLELCGAVLLTRLMMEIATVMKIDKTYLHAWTDSTVVLAWLNSHPSRWKVFVANRVSEIITSLDSHHWSHVSSKCNPADAASRGQSPTELIKNTIWFEGPDFLHRDQIEYSKPKDVNTNIEEVKIKTHCTIVEGSILERFSSLTRMIRIIAYCRRFIHNLKVKKLGRYIGYLTTRELSYALNCCIRQCQNENFKEEIDTVRKGENLPKRSSLRMLNPVLDDNQVLRVGGRLEHAPISTNRKHPILIPKKSHLTDLIVRDAHKQTLHGGPQLMLCYLQAKYWIVGARQLVKSCFRSCVTCVKNTGSTRAQLMGQLPSVRTTPSRAFSSSGVDYAGPIQIRTAKGRGNKSHKGYICIFVCMVTRAVHLEAVTDLTTEAFLQAFKRFVSRRGYCSEIWSDNATNFTGAAKELKKLFRNEKGSMIQEVAESLATNGCSWNFIPTQSPNFGGLWEAGVKSLKYHLKRIIGVSTLTFEELSTVLTQVEACLNSRPLSVLTGNDDEFTVLTPGHFLVGEALVTPPDHNFESSTISSLRRWQYTQKLTQEFWRQWSKQYLTKFYKRYRWSSQIPQPQVGDIVTVREDNLPVCRWLYAKVIATHPGQDNLVRVVTLKVKNGTIKRPVNKLCLLPVTC